MRKAFTLIEILTVILIMSLLLTIGAYSYVTAQKQNRDAQRKTDLNTIKSALENYYVDYRHYVNYKAGISLSANWQLGDCSGSTSSVPPKTALTPKYITLIPSSVGSNYNITDCKTPTGSYANEYLYMYKPDKQSIDADKDSPLSYYLMAEVERDTNANMNTNIDPTPARSHNYFIQNAAKD